MSDDKKCPFSKAIISEWCACQYAKLYDRPAGKMYCQEADVYRDGCLALDQMLRDKCRFVLKITSSDTALTHAQAMKIGCGGILGIQTVLGFDLDNPPRVPQLLAEARQRYGDLEGIPFDDVVKYVQSFQFRKRRGGHEA